MLSLPFLKKKKEHFLVIEILPDFRRISLVDADFDKKEMLLMKVRTLQKEGMDAIRKGLKGFGKLGDHKIVIALDSLLATTVYSAVSLVRDNPKDSIDDVDLDNLVSQAVWKFFDRQRSKVAAKLDINDFDLLLTDVRIGNIRLDGHRVINPIGFKARAVEIQLGQTFASRAIVDQLRAVLPMENVVFIGEAGASWARVIGNAEKDRTFVLANIYDSHTALFYADGFRLAHYASYDWGSRRLTALLADTLQVSTPVAERIMEEYLQANASPVFLKKIETFLLEELGVLAEKLDGAMQRMQAKLAYLHSFSAMPPVVFEGAFRSKFQSPPRLLPVTHEFFGEKYHFQLRYKKEAYRDAAFPVCAAVVETTFLPHYAKMSHMAKKRVRWLSPTQ